MIADHWPLYGLRLATPRLELRLPSPDELAALADLATGPIHDQATQPFLTEWTDAPPAERGRSAVIFHYGTVANWQPGNWSLALVAVADGSVIGTQALDGRRFATLRQVATGSWLGAAYQGKGYGTEMRAAVLALAFEGLNAEVALSGAFLDNVASLQVSRRLGYVDNGVNRHVIRGAVVREQRLSLDRAAWAAHRRFDVTIDGLDPCLPLFGAV